MHLLLLLLLLLLHVATLLLLLLHHPLALLVVLLHLLLIVGPRLLGIPKLASHSHCLLWLAFGSHIVLVRAGPEGVFLGPRGRGSLWPHRLKRASVLHRFVFVKVVDAATPADVAFVRRRSGSSTASPAATHDPATACRHRVLHSCCILSTCGGGGGGCGGGGGGRGRCVHLFLPDVGPLRGIGIAGGARRPRLFGRVLSRAAPLPLGGGGVGVIEEVLRRIVVRRPSHRPCSWNGWLLLLLLPGCWDACGRGGPLLSHFCRLHLLVLLKHLLLMLVKLVRVLLHRSAAIHLVHLLLMLLLLMHHMLLLLDLLLLLQGLLRVSHVVCR